MLLYGGGVMNTASEQQKTWEATRIQNLLRHKNGRYYARLFLNDKEIWKALKTSHFSVAEAKIAELQKENRERRGRGIDPGNARMTFGQAASLHMQRVDEDVALKRRTRKYWKEIQAALLKSWPTIINRRSFKVVSSQRTAVMPREGSVLLPD